MMNRIVVGTDGSDTAKAATREAAALAAAVGATLIVVQAYHDRHPHSPMEAYDPTQHADPASVDLPRDVAHPVGRRAEVLAALEREVAALADLDVSEIIPVAHEGKASEALIEVAEHEQAELIVVGSKGMHSASRFVLGSVPDRLTHHAPCNVLVVRTT